MIDKGPPGFPLAGCAGGGCPRLLGYPWALALPYFVDRISVHQLGVKDRGWTNRKARLGVAV
jgi:hypothetical protein